MPNKQKQKGDRFERRCVGFLRDIGCEAQRVPLSGGAGGEFSGDIKIKVPALHLPLLAECKSRAGCGGYKQIVDWLGTNDVLFLNVARDEPVVALSWRLFSVLINRLRTSVERDEDRGTSPEPGHGDGSDRVTDEGSTEDRVSDRELIYEELCAAARPTTPILPDAPGH